MSACLCSQRGLVWALGSALLLTLGCDDPLKSLALIEETRVLGARVEVAGDPARGSPRPGEQAAVRFFVAGPEGQPDVSYALSVCGVSPTNNGFPACSGSEFAMAQQAQPSAQSPSLAFEIPTDLDVLATPHGLVSGQIAGGEVAFEFELGSATHSNANPSFDSGELTLDGAPWPVTTDAAPCGDLLTVTAGSRHELGAQLDDENFEPLAQLTSLDPARETLLLSEFSNAGSLDHAFTSLGPDTQERARAIWHAPTKAEESGTLVRFYFVVRDMRGGEDFATRAACVLP